MNLYHSYKQYAPPVTNLVDRLRYWSEHQPGEIAFYYLDDEDQVSELTYAELDRQARAIAARLMALGLEGERALLLYPPGLEFVAAFLGCLYAGTTAVPALPPRRNRKMARVEAISENARAAAVLSVLAVVQRSASVLDDSPHLNEVPWVATERVSTKLAEFWTPPDLADDTLAVLQYTSGSTGQPKGVMLSHANLMHNCALITYGFEADRTSLGLSWLPTYHDMGLVGGILNPLYVGRPNILMSPMSFLQKPIRWLRGISRFGVTISGGPNFAYALCNEKINVEDCQGLDLSTWKVAYNGAEPVRADTLAIFTGKFEQFGFRPQTHYPCYGMAETTLIVSGTECCETPFVQAFDAQALESNQVVPVSDADHSVRRLVGSGCVLPDQQVLIVNPESCEPCSDGHVGEIWVISNSVSKGYWDNEQETRRVFHGQLAIEDNRRFLRTGDLGFFYENQLFVTGRTKDLIIINGRNLYPHDIELAVENAHEALRVGGGAAFSIDSGTGEKLIVTQELERDYRNFDIRDIADAIHKSVFDLVDIAPQAIVLLKPGKLPKTSSGKVQRSACRTKYLLSELDAIGHWQTAGDFVCNTESKPKIATEVPVRNPHGVLSIESWLVDSIAQRLKIAASQVDVNQTFAHFGLDSVALIGMSGELEDFLGHRVSPKVLFMHPTIAELSVHLASLDGSAQDIAADNLPENPIAGNSRVQDNQAIESLLEQPASKILANFDDLSKTQVDQLLKTLLREKARQDVVTHGLSFGQRALWFLYQMDPSSSAYNIMYAARVPAGFDRDAFCRSFQEIINRHEILRTTYAMAGGLPVQNVQGWKKFQLHTFDARTWNRSQLDTEIQSAADAPFDLQQGPVIRVHLYEQQGEHHVLLFAAHHIALDFWSFDLLFDELEDLYRSDVTDRARKVPNVKLQYKDFTLWQDKFIDGPECRHQWDYWRNELGENLPVLDLPTNHPRPALQSFRGTSLTVTLEDGLVRQLIEFSKSQGVTPFATYLAAFQVLLYRYSGQEDILVGCPTAGRDRAEFAHVLGYFVNPIALRARLSADQPFTRFLGQVRRTLIGGITNQDIPFPLLADRIQAPRDASRPPVFQVAFGWNQPRRLQLKTIDTALAGHADNSGFLGLQPFSMGQQGSAFDLMLMMLNTGDGVTAAFQYNLDLFNESRIARMADHYQKLLQSIVHNPNCSLADLPILSTSEKELLIGQHNETAADYDSSLCLHELFERQADQTPGAIAVQYDQDQLTYRQLDEQANQLAHYLVKLGVGPEVVVGLYIDRSIEMIVGLLGVLKAGGAYVPLLPGTPRQRLTYMLQECRSPVVLTQQELAGDLSGCSSEIICLDRDRQMIAKENRNPGAGSPQPSNLAYVIFTSGSTGQPKGVLVEHRSVVNFLTSMQQIPGIADNDVLLAVTPLTFDISLLELFLPLTVGAKVVVVCPGVAADSLQLAKTIDQTRATVMQATPATWRLLVEAGWTGNPKLKILCGGEALPPDLVQPLLDRGASLWNMYGPTETTIWSAVDQVQERSDPMPIGRPIANTTMYILDRHLQPVPLGVKGELYIGGAGLARGYLNRPEQTAQKFIEDPFCNRPRARLYKTGDLARYDEYGRIEFLGRDDLQVKIRGFRIELSEIETHLTSHPAIRNSVVVARNSGLQIDDKQLVGYFTCWREVPNASELREFLKQKLPGYMLPSIFVPLEELPLNPSGKIDRQALPDPGCARPELRAPYVAPRNATEEKMVRIWASVLGLDQVGIHDNFFELGGASMQSLAVTTLAVQAGMGMTPASLFKYPTVAELSSSDLLQKPENVDDEMKTMVCNSDLTNNGTLTVPESAARKNAKPDTESTNIVIESLGVYLPPKSVPTDEIISGCKYKVLFPLEEMTGIQSRRVSANDEFTSDIAARAVSQCLDNSKYTADQIDLVICCHIGRDESPKSAQLEPGTAMYLKRRFGFPNAIALDINNACAGMFTGISVAQSYIENGAARRAMVVSAEHLSPVVTTAQQEISGFLDPRMACLTLGDAGAAIILEAGSGNNVGFHELELYSLSKYNALCVGKPTEYEHGGPILLVPDPIKQTSIAIENSIIHAKLVMDQSPWKPEMINHVIMHQTSQRSLLDGARAINRAFGQQICTPENTINNLAERGNTASTSHFVAVWDNVLNGNIQTGDNVVFGITGSGQTIGTGLYTFDDLPERIRQRENDGRSVSKTTRVDELPATALIQKQRIRVESVGVIPAASKLPTHTMPMVKHVVENCLGLSEYDKSGIDLVLFAGMYRTDFISEPAVATMIAGQLQINDEIQPGDLQRTLAFDVFNGGLGLLNACDIAAQMLRCGRIQTALVIASEIENNRDHYPGEIMGLQETASAILLDRDAQDQVGFGEFVFRYAPEHLEARTVTGQYNTGNPCIHLQQDPIIADLYLQIIPQAVEELLGREELSISEIDVVLPPQFSIDFLEALSRALDIPRPKFVDLTGNGKDWFTSALPYSLHEIKTRDLARTGDIGLVINVGSGLQVGCAIYYF